MKNADGPHGLRAKKNVKPGSGIKTRDDLTEPRRTDARTRHLFLEEEVEQEREEEEEEEVNSDICLSPCLIQISTQPGVEVNLFNI